MYAVLSSGRQEDWDRYRNLRNLGVREVRKDHRKFKVKEAEKWELDASTSKMWRTIKNAAGWGSASAPTEIRKDPTYSDLLGKLRNLSVASLRTKSKL